MSFVLTDGTSVVSFNAEYNLQDGAIISENSHRTRGGELYNYTWFEKDTWKIPVSHVNSSFKYTINTWRKNSSILSLTPHGSTAVSTVLLVGKGIPISNYIEPYDNLFRGTIEIEEK